MNGQIFQQAVLWSVLQVLQDRGRQRLRPHPEKLKSTESSDSLL